MSIRDAESFTNPKPELLAQDVDYSSCLPLRVLWANHIAARLERLHQRIHDPQRTAERDLRGFIEICVETKDWERLSTRILDVGHGELEDLSHYVTERAAQGLERKHPAAAAKVHRALAMRILKAGKSKYYRFALEHLRTARRLYEKLANQAEWQVIIAQIRRDHARKHGFVADFEEIVAGHKPEPPESLAERSRRRRKEQTDGECITGSVH